MFCLSALNNINKSSGYNIQLFNTAGGMNMPLGQPENLVKDESGNAYLKTSILIEYYFEREQPLLVTIICSKEGLPKEKPQSCLSRQPARRIRTSRLLQHPEAVRTEPIV